MENNKRRPRPKTGSGLEKFNAIYLLSKSWPHMGRLLIALAKAMQYEPFLHLG